MQLSLSEVAWRIQSRIRTRDLARQRAQQHVNDIQHAETDAPFIACQALRPLQPSETGWEQIKAPRPPKGLLPENQVLRIVKPYFFEPNHGYMVDLDTRSYMRESLRYDSWMCLENNAWKYPLIYFGSPLLTFSSMQIQRVPLAITLAHAFPENYYHFVHDVLARLPTIFPYITPKCVVILPAGSTDSAFAKELLGHPALSHIRFVDPKYTHIIADETILLSGGTPQKSDWIAIQERLVTLDTSTKRKKCLFIIRGQRPDGTLYDRSILNEADVVRQLDNSDIDTISFGGLSVARQMELVNAYEHVISAHGAALTNICWVRHPTFTLTEIHMADRKIDCYKSIVSTMGWTYKALLEGPSFRRRGTTLYNVDAEHVLNAA